MSLFLDCGGKPEYLKKTCAHRRTRELNQESHYNQAIVLTPPPKKTLLIDESNRHVFNYNGIQIRDSLCELMLHSQLTKVFAS